MRLRWAFSPTRPQQAAGIRIEPPPSLPCASGTMPGPRRLRPTAPEPAGRAPQIPRVARGPEAMRLGHRQDPHLRHVRDADDHEARLAQPAHDEGVVAGHEVAEQVRAHGERHPGHGAVVLDRDRHAGERPLVARPDRVGGREGALVGDVGEGVDGRLQRLDAVQRRLHQLARRQLAGAHSSKDGRGARARDGLRSSRGCLATQPLRAWAGWRPYATPQCPQRELSHPVANRVRGALRRTHEQTKRDREVQSGLEGVVAFATEIAEPDREGGALRYRGVDIEDLVGNVPFEQVWGLLVDGTSSPGCRPPSRTR